MKIMDEICLGTPSKTSDVIDLKVLRIGHMKVKIVILALLSILILPIKSLGAKNYIIYSVVQDIPMGFDNEIPKKNFYINMGSHQGVKKDTILDVYRTISRLDPYSSKKRFNYKINIGKLQILHSEESAAIGRLVKLENGKNSPLYEIDGFMIGDQVDIHITD